MQVSKNARTVLERRYLAKDRHGTPIETPEEMLQRVAKNIAAVDARYGASEEEVRRTETTFLDIMDRLEFLPNSPTLMNAGRDLQQLSACFVLPVEDSMESIFEAVKNAALIHKSGGGTGFSFSRLRPKNDVVRSTGGVASGPVSFMKVFNAATEAVKQGGCVDENTRVATADGLIRIKDLGPADLPEDSWHTFTEPLRVYTDDGMKEANEFYVHGKARVKRITTRCGYSVTTTLNHRLRVIDEEGNYVWKHARDIKRGDRVVLQKNTYPETTNYRLPEFEYKAHFGTREITVPQKPSEELGELIGYFIGNGCYSFDESGTAGVVFTVADDEPEVLQRIVYLGRELFALEPAFRKNPGGRSTNLCYGSTVLAHWLKHIGVDKTSSGKMKVPEIVFRAGKRFALGFLRGLFSADGSVTKDGHVSLYSISGEFIAEIQQLMLSLGMPSRVSVNNNRDDAFGKNPVFRLTLITREGYRVFQESVKPVNSAGDHWQVLMEQQEEIAQSPVARLLKSDQFYDRVEDIQDGEAFTLDLSVPANNTYIAGGFVSHNTRRGANMGILRVDHPDIMEFITCKEDPRAITNFNISVGITEEFMAAVNAGEPYDLINPRTGQVSGQLNARDVFDKLVEMAWHNGEPGIVFLDRLNAANPTPHVGEIESTNPCGEQPLLPYESCNLGSINLAKFVVNGTLDWERLQQVVYTAVHFLDNVIDANRYPLPQIEDMTKANRKIGLGVMGFADMLILRGIPYDSEEALEAAEEVMKFIRQEARQASIELAAQRGPFPNFKGSIYDNGETPPLRNATVTTIAPTGTISIIANCSSGIEPLFAVAYTRTVLDDDELVEVNPLFEEIARREGFYSPDLMKAVARKGSVRGIDEIPKKIQRLFVTAHEISPEHHVRMQAAFQRYTDNAVSKTVNLPHSATREDVARVFQEAYRLGCKGVTIYRDGSRSHQVLAVKKKEEEKKQEAPAGPPRAVVRPRPQVTRGRTERIPTAHGNMYVTINEDEYGICEVFAQTGKSGGDAAANNEAIARLISTGLRAGIPVEEIIKQLRGIRSSTPVWFNGGMVLSGPDGIAIALERYLHWRKTGKELDSIQTAIDIAAPAGECPECGGILKFEEGCSTCPQCGYSKCG